MTAAAKGSVSAPMLITKDEATAAQRTILFHLCKTADQTDATGLVPVVTLSKAGGAFAGAVGAVTELANGWYKFVADAGDVDTLGQLAMRVAVATADTLDVVHQVVAFDLNTATVAVASIAANAVSASALAADAVNEIQSGLATAAGVSAVTLATTTVSKALGTVTNADGASSALNTAGKKVATSTLDTIDVTFQVTGTWDGASAKVQTTQDPAATVPVWTDYVDALTDNPLTANGAVIVTGGGHKAARVLTSSKGAATSLAVTAVIRKAASA